MTYLQALYGSQYYEIAERGGDTNKSRYNGNIFLAAFIILILLDILLAWIRFVPGANEDVSREMHSIFGFLSGKTIGQVLAIPLFALVYVIITKTVGTEENFKRHVAAFSLLPAEIRKKANRKLLTPFLTLTVLLFLMAITAL